MRPRLRQHALVLAAYSVITAVVTYPLILRLTTDIPGRGDAPWFVWQLWWVKHAILDLRQSPLTTNLIYFPLNDVPATWQSPVNELTAVPLVASFGPVLAYNLLIMSTFVLAGYGMYLLGWQVLRRRDLAFIAGLIYSFSAYHAMRSLHHLSLATIQWLPLALVTALNCWRKPTLRRAVAAGVTTALVALSSPYYVAYFLLPVAIAAGWYAVLWRRPALGRPAVWRAAAIASLTALVIVAPFYISLLTAAPDVQQAAREAAASVNIYTADVLSWLLPPRHNPLWQAPLAATYAEFTEGYLVETALFFGLVPLALAIVALFRRRLPVSGDGFWRILFVTALLLSFGPVLRLNLETVVKWMPYRLFMLLPGSFAFRAPARIGLIAVLAGTLLALALVKQLMMRRPHWAWRPLLVAGSALLLVNMTVEFPWPVNQAAPPPAYDAIAADGGQGAVLDLPAGEMFQDRTSWAMAYQTWHNKPLVSGYLGRRPERLQVPEQTMPFVSRFFHQDWDAYFAGRWQDLVAWPAAPDVLAGNWPEDVRYARDLLAEQGISYVVLHRDEDNPGYFESAGLLLSQGLGPPAFSDEDTLRFDVSPPRWIQRGSTSAIDSAALRFGPAFSEPFLHRQSQARAVLPDAATPVTVTLDAPIAGRWLVRGQLDGENAGDVQLLLDGSASELQVTALFKTVDAFETTLDLAAGQHQLAFSRSASGATTAGSEPCSELCVLNLTASLESPQNTLPATPIATLVDDNGQQARLETAGIVQSPAGETLVTTWQLPAGFDMTDPPTLYVHITDAAGNTVAQADHVLGENSFWHQNTDQAVTLIDVVALPAAAGDLEIRVGLWRPDTQSYFWATDSVLTDAAGRVPLGTIGELMDDRSVR